MKGEPIDPKQYLEKKEEKKKKKQLEKEKKLQDQMALEHQLIDDYGNFEEFNQETFDTFMLYLDLEENKKKLEEKFKTLLQKPVKPNKFRKIKLK